MKRKRQRKGRTIHRKGVYMSPATGQMRTKGRIIKVIKQYV